MPVEFDYGRLASELLRHLRGKRSQVSFSRRMGYSTNTAHSWETGKRFPGASAFLGFALKLRPEVNAAIVAFPERPRSLHGVDLTRREGLAALLRVLRGDFAINEIGATIDVNRATISRWLQGAGEPRLPEFLHLVQACTQRLLEFVAIFAPPDALPSTRRAWADLQAQVRVAYELPWSHAVLRVLETEAYARLERHEPGFIARELGIPLAEEERALASLSRANQVRRTARGFRPTHVLSVDTNRDPEGGRKLKQHWAEVGLERLRAGGDGLFSYNLFAVAEEDYRRLLALHVDYFERMRAIIAASPRSERVVLANLQLMSLTRNDTQRRRSRTPASVARFAGPRGKRRLGDR
jgi:DNA-binding transcriptional regulator YiaG